MGYLFLSIAIICSIIKGYCGKKSGTGASHTSEAVLINLFRMSFCVIIGVIIAISSAGISGLKVSSDVILISVISGVSSAVFVVTWLMSIRLRAYMLVNVFLLLGVIVPMVLCKVFYGEPITLIQWIGVALLISAGLCMCSYDRSLKGKMSPYAYLTLILCALSSGVTDFSQKMFRYSDAYSPSGSAVFNFYTYIFATVTLVICFLVFRFIDKKKEPDIPSPMKTVAPVLGYVAVMAAALFFNSFLKTLAAGYLDASIIYPLNQGGSLILSSLMARFVFKEKLNSQGVIGIVLCGVSLIIINVL